jgi:hypothetical protein
LTTSQPPEDAHGHIPPRRCVENQRVTIPAAWWVDRLHQYNAPGAAIDPTLGSLSRADVWRLAAGASDSDDAAAGLLWHALAWGAGTKLRHCRRRIKAIAHAPGTTLAALRRAARLATTDPAAAYAVLHPRRGRPAIGGLGPAFGTKFLYFAGGGNPTHPCSILDSRVATTLRTSGWPSLPLTGWWPDTYSKYCQLTTRWADDLSKPGEPVHPDQIEFWLFNANRSQNVGPS